MVAIDCDLCHRLVPSDASCEWNRGCPDLPRCGWPMLARSPAWLKSGIGAARFGRIAQGGAVGPARAGVSWLTGPVEDLVAPVGVGCCRPLRVAAPGRLCLGCSAGLSFFRARRPVAVPFRPGMLPRPQVLAGG